MNGSSVLSSSYLEKVKRIGTRRGFTSIKEIFYSDSKLLRDMVEALSLDSFKVVLDRTLDNLI